MTEENFLILRNCHWAIFNANDFFEWACADSVCCGDMDAAVEVVERFGQDGINALLVHLRRQDPQAPVVAQMGRDGFAKYKEALTWLRENYPDLVETHIEELF